MNEPPLLYQRQFVAGTRPVNVPQSWISIRISDLHVSHHPELSASIASSEQVTVLLLGEVYDPQNIPHDNETIIRSLVSNVTNFGDFEAITKRFHGRWVGIVAIRNDLRIYPDANSLHGIFYTPRKSRDDDLWMGSQPALLADFCGVKKDKDIIREYDKSEWIGWWIGTETPYENVKKLPPNHYLDIADSNIYRFWPTSNLEPLELEDAANRLSKLTRSSIDAMLNRSPISIDITGGWDSRIALAHCDPKDPRIRFLSRHYPLMDSHDIWLPQKLIRRAGGKLTVLRISDDDLHGPDILETYRRNTGFMLWHNRSAIHSANLRLPQGCIVLGGHGTEYIRDQPGGRETLDSFDNGEFTSEHLAEFCGLQGNEHAVRQLRNWMDNYAPSESDIYLPGLVDSEFIWGNWTTLVCTAANTFALSIPLCNSLEMLEIGHRVDVKHRLKPYDLAKEWCLAGSPWVLDFPVNSGIRTTIRKSISSLTDLMPWRVRNFMERQVTRFVWTKFGTPEHYQLVKDYPPTVETMMARID